MVALQVIGVLVAVAGLTFFVLGKTTDLVKLKYQEIEFTMPFAALLILLGIVMLTFPLWQPRPSIAGPGSPGASQDPPVSTMPAPGQGTVPNLLTPVTPNPPALFPIKIDPVDAPVPLCATFTGTGEAPPGRHLWLLVINSSQEHYFKGVVQNPIKHTWSATNVSIGTPETRDGTPYTIHAVLVDDTTNLLIQKHHYNEDQSAEIPNTVLYKDQIQISRRTDLTKCGRPPR